MTEIEKMKLIQILKRENAPHDLINEVSRTRPGWIDSLDVLAASGCKAGDLPALYRELQRADQEVQL